MFDKIFLCIFRNIYDDYAPPDYSDEEDQMAKEPSATSTTKPKASLAKLITKAAEVEKAENKQAKDVSKRRKRY